MAYQFRAELEGSTRSYTHRKEYVQWIEAAKKPETRLRRIGVARAKLDERSKATRGRTP